MSPQVRQDPVERPRAEPQQPDTAVLLLQLPGLPNLGPQTCGRRVRASLRGPFHTYYYYYYYYYY